MKGKNAQDESEFMNEFFQDVGAIKTAMGNIRRNVKLVEEKYVQALTTVNTDQANSILLYPLRRLSHITHQSFLIHVCSFTSQPYTNIQFPLSSICIPLLFVLINAESTNEIQTLIDNTNRSVTDVRAMLETMKKKNQQFDAKVYSFTYS